MHFAILTRHLPVLSLSKYSLTTPKRPAHLLSKQTFAVTIRPIRPMRIQKIHFIILLTADSLPLTVACPERAEGSSCKP